LNISLLRVHLVVTEMLVLKVLLATLVHEVHLEAMENLVRWVTLGECIQ
jgi:hypothetical protein